MPRKGLGRGLEAILTAPNAADPRPDEQVESLDVAEIRFNPLQPRSHIDPEALKGLCAVHRSTRGNPAHRRAAQGGGRVLAGRR